MSSIIHVQREEIVTTSLTVFDAVEAYLEGDDDVGEALGWPSDENLRKLTRLVSDADGVCIQCERLEHPHQEAIKRLRADRDRVLAELEAQAKALLPLASWGG